MESGRPLWLVTNDMSGSNDARALDAIRASCEGGGLRVAYRTSFPDEDPPTPAMLDAGGIELVAIFAGDGTLNAMLEAIAGWGGEVLVLPGGTMNLLYHRLFGEREMDEAIAAVCSGEASARRPTVIRSEGGTAYAGLLAGPGTSWNQVREALRETAVIDLAEGTVRAIEATLGEAGVACAEPAFGRREGYPLILLNPLEDGIETLAYHAESPREYLEQTFALLRRDFREGPHDLLGKAPRIVLESSDGCEFGVLYDGEPGEARGRLEIELVRSEVDLLAMRQDG